MAHQSIETPAFPTKKGIATTTKDGGHAVVVVVVYSLLERVIRQGPGTRPQIPGHSPTNTRALAHKYPGTRPQIPGHSPTNTRALAHKYPGTRPLIPFPAVAQDWEPFGHITSAPIGHPCPSSLDRPFKPYLNWSFRTRTLSGYAIDGRCPEGFAQKMIGQSADHFVYSLHKALLCFARPCVIRRGKGAPSRRVGDTPGHGRLRRLHEWIQRA